jgi:hypothetical protein
MMPDRTIELKEKGLLSPVPDGLAAINALYGNPDRDGDWVLDPDFIREQLVVIPLPYQMRLSWSPGAIISRVQCHRLVAESLTAALQEVLEFVGLTELQAREWDRWGGCFEFRKMRGYAARSVHSWGCAVDLNPDCGRFGHREDIATYPIAIRDAFRRRGWDWGGAWPQKYSADAQHFQACRGY